MTITTEDIQELCKLARLGLANRTKERHDKRQQQVLEALEKIKKKEEEPKIIHTIKEWVEEETWVGKCPK
jgi:sugar diacid utilization regulator